MKKQGNVNSTVFLTGAEAEEAAKRIGIGFWELNPNTGKTRFSPEWFSMLGYSEGEYEANDDTWKSLLHPDDKNTAVQCVQSGIRGGEGFECCFRLQAKDGTYRWILSKGRVTDWDEKKQPNRVLGVHIDITERTQKEQALKKAYTQINTLFNTIPGMAIAVSKDYEVLNINNALKDYLQIMDKHQVIGKDLYEAVDSRSPIKFRTLFARCLESQIPETRFTDPDEEKESGIYAEMYAKPMKDDTGAVVGSVQILMDISFLKSAQEGEKEMRVAFLAEQERLAVTLSSIADGVIATDTKGRIVLMNKAASELTGWEQEHALGKNLSEVYVLKAEASNEFLNEPISQIWENPEKSSEPRHAVLVGADGTERNIVDKRRAVKRSDGTILGSVFVVNDETQILRMQDSIIKSYKLESMGVLAGGIAHDFNNILTGILGNVSLARTFLKAEDKLDTMLKDVEKASIQARNLTQQLLAFSRGGAPIKEEASIQEIIKDSAMFTLRGSNVRCFFDFEEGLWPVHIDKGQMSQLIHNLILNADQAMPEGGEIRITAENRNLADKASAPLAAGEYVYITVADTGPGIQPNQRFKIFDPYFSTKEEGNGLGLSIAYTVARRHGGLLALDEAYGKGGKFTVYVPAAPDALEKVPGTEEGFEAGKGKILLMDDEDIVRKSVSRMLERLGYTVDLAFDGNEALNKYRKAIETDEKYDLVIMDLTIPGGMGGKEAIHLFHEIDPGVRAIVSSGYSNDPIMASCKDYGFCGVISKPFRLKDLSRVCKKILDQ